MVGESHIVMEEEVEGNSEEETFIQELQDKKGQFCLEPGK